MENEVSSYRQSLHAVVIWFGGGVGDDINKITRPGSDRCKHTHKKQDNTKLTEITDRERKH